MTPYKNVDCDILIIGAGGAGLRAAIAAHDAGAKVIVVSKTLLGKSHTVMAEGGINAALGNVDPKDNWMFHFRDTIIEGQMISNYRMVEILSQEAPERVKELEYWGAVFDRTQEGKIMQRAFGAHTYKRTCHVGDRIGLEIMQTLKDQIVHRDIEIMEEILITGLLVKNNHILGAMAVELRTGKFLFFKTKAVIMATGGCGRLFKISSNSWEAIGDGVAIAYRAGAEIIDMEMIQFHPTGMVWPANVRGMLVTESVRGEGGWLLNNKNQRFMKKYEAKRMELGPRDVVSRAVYSEIEQGRGTEHGGVYLDISHMGKEFIEHKLPRMVAQFKEFADIDITKERMEVAPTVHYMMGGIKVDVEDSMSTVNGLFAAGECVGGVHGANRLGGNSLADILVFGKRAGEFAATYVENIEFKEHDKEDMMKEFERVMIPFKNKTNIKPQTLKKRIQDIMWEHVGIVRNEERLLKALKEIEEIRTLSKRVSVSGGLKYNHEWIDAMDVQNMVLICEMIIRSALYRKESRGAHYRGDFSKKDDKNWLVNTICKNVRGVMTLSKSKVPEMPSELKKLLVEKP